MRNIILSTILALLVFAPGKMDAHPIELNSSLETCVLNRESKIDNELRELIFRKLHQEGAMCYNDLCEFWNKGKVFIDKSPMGYVVTLQINNNGTVIIGIIDDI